MSEENIRPFHGDGSPQNHSPPTSCDHDNRDLRHDSTFSEKHQELVPSPVPVKVGTPRDSGFGASLNRPTPAKANSGSSPNLTPGSNSSSRSSSSASSVDPASNHYNSIYSGDSPDTTVEGGASKGEGGAYGGPIENQHYGMAIEAKTKDGGAQKGRRKKNSLKQVGEEQATAGKQLRHPLTNPDKITT